ncbi:MAG: hypothetical protein EBU90_18585 [Proteobacteria bacterium]|nr:hypothetical protein [Pseudomonadota bacterium]NBP14641.1 hypothetical protein [bacterium]
MYNPLVPDLSKLKSDDIELKIAELIRKYTIASRCGQSSVCAQISVLLEHYKNEQHRRHLENQKKLQEKNKDFDDIINVDR